MEPSEILIVFAAGAAVGLAYWATLWLVVRRLPGTRHPGLWLLSTATVRLTLLLAAFFVLMDGNWQRLGVCVAGFLAARLAMTTWAKSGLPATGLQR